MEAKRNGQALVLYDGVCAMCNGFVRFVLERDPGGRFLFAPLQSEVAVQTLQHHGYNANDLDTMYLITDFRTPAEHVFARSIAVIETFRRVGGVWSVFGVLRYAPAPIRDFFYSLVVKYRYRVFGRYESCPLPRPEWRVRFIDQID